MDIESAKPRQTESQASREAIAEQRAQQRVERDKGEDSSRVGLLRITRPLDIMDDTGGDPYNSTGRFTRKQD
jgi:hypothetical protein